MGCGVTGADQCDVTVFCDVDLSFNFRFSWLPCKKKIVKYMQKVSMSL
jgi:hypothetical protein